MPAPTLYSLMRQVLAHARFDTPDTRAVMLKAVDAIEQSDNDLPASSIEDHEDVQLIIADMKAHLYELLGNPISQANEDDVIISTQHDDDEEEDEIERHQG